MIDMYSNLLDATLNYIETALPDLYAIPRAAPLSLTDDAISVLIGPSSINTEYQIGKADTMLLRIMAKSQDSLKALNAVSLISLVLEKATKADIQGDGFCFIQGKIYTNPNFYYMDAKDTYVYGSMINVEFIRS